MSQTQSQKDSIEIDLHQWLTSTFTFEKPSHEFTALVDGSGYLSKKYNATIKLLTVPGTLAKLQEEYRNIKPKTNSIIIDSSNQEIGDKKYLIRITEEISPNKKKFENQISVTVATELNGLLLFVVGVYPKSNDKQLRESFIKSGYTIRKD
jgi:hypothetical protein